MAWHGKNMGLGELHIREPRKVPLGFPPLLEKMEARDFRRLYWGTFALALNYLPNWLRAG